MILFYVRHGDPIYDPDSLTPLGKRQAEALFAAPFRERWRRSLCVHVWSRL